MLTVQPSSRQGDRFLVLHTPAIFLESSDDFLIPSGCKIKKPACDLTWRWKMIFHRAGLTRRCFFLFGRVQLFPSVCYQLKKYSSKLNEVLDGILCVCFIFFFNFFLIFFLNFKIFNSNVHESGQSCCPMIASIQEKHYKLHWQNCSQTCLLCFLIYLIGYKL